MEIDMKWLWSCTRKYTQNHDDREDLMQATAERMWVNRHRFDGKYPKAWAKTIMRGIYIDGKRRQGEQFVLQDDPDKELPGSPTVLQPEIEELPDMFLSLPQGQREALYWTAVEGLPYHEAAERLGVATHTIGSRLNRAKAAIKEVVDG